MNFAAFSQALEVVESVSSRSDMTMNLANFFAQLSPIEAKCAAYMVLGQIGPSYAGLQFNFAERGLLKVLGNVYSLPGNEVQALMNQYGDLGLVARQLSLQYLLQAGIESFDSSLLGVFNFFSEIQRVSGSGSQEKKERMISLALRHLDALSVKFFIRILAGNLRLGFSDMTLLDALSCVAVGDKTLRLRLEAAYNACADVGVIAEVLIEKGIDALGLISIKPGIPMRPAAAERMSSAEEIIKKLGPCVAQPKLDGFRLQVHIVKHQDKKTSIHFFSRNLQDMSPMFPDLCELVEQLPVESCVFEGEAIAFDANSGQFLPFQETVKRKRKHDVQAVAEEFPLKLFAFDLLFLNGKSCLDLQHWERREKLIEILSKLSPHHQEYLQIIEEKSFAHGEVLESYFYSSVATGLEGLVVKRPDAIYQPGKRNFNWIKLKRQETGSLDDTLDCVVLGYFFGSGKRAKFGIGALLVGVYDSNNDQYQTTAKIGTGLTDEEWVLIKKTCDTLKVDDWHAAVECDKDLYPDVMVAPSIVCMIRADEITFSPVHSAAKKNMERGLALRFPRFMGLRPDKAATEATSVDELIALFKKQKIRTTR